MVKISENFRLNEFLKSETANKLNIDNRPSVLVVENLKNLILNVMQPLRTEIGSPIIITSGFRCATLNKMIGGKPNSQHLMGYACDFITPYMDLQEVFKLIKKKYDYDQLLYEYNHKGEKWLHISYVTNRKNRRQAINNYKSS